MTKIKVFKDLFLFLVKNINGLSYRLQYAKFNQSLHLTANSAASELGVKIKG